MPAQDFTDADKVALQQAATNFINDINFAANRQNMTKAEQKASDSAAIQLKIDAINAQILNLDNKYTVLKANELTSLNASLSFYQALQTKILNTPE